MEDEKKPVKQRPDEGVPEGEEAAPEEEQAEEGPKPVLLHCPAEYVLSEADGGKIGGGEAELKLDADKLALLPKLGEALVITLRDIAHIAPGDYTVELTLSSKEKLVLSKAGYKYEDLVRLLTRLRNEVLLRDMLMNETVVKAEAAAEFVRRDAAGREMQKGACEPRLYETALVIMPDSGQLVRIPYSEMAELKDEPYQVSLRTDYGDTVTFSRMGRELDPWKRDLAGAMNALAAKAQETVKELLPKSDPSVIRRVARLMREGKAARRVDIEAVSPDLWARLEAKLDEVGLKEGYAFLGSLAQRERMCIGLKRGLMGGLTGEYAWFLAPIYGADPKAPGNAMAMEAAAGEGGGRATYFFRILPRALYAAGRSLPDLNAAADAAMARLGRCLMAINFRREPVYLSDDQLLEKRYARYLYAVDALPELRELRGLFIGRAIHGEKWQDDIRALLAFNVSASEDERWKRPL